MIVTKQITYIPLPHNVIQLRENKPSYTKHDILFKRLLETFFAEFIEAFFPDLYQKIDFSSLKYLSEELVPHLHDENERRLDIVAEVKWKSTAALVVIHVEPQSYVQTDFNKRMFHYFSQLHRKVDKPIIPIAIFSYDDKWEKDEYQIQVDHIEVLRFSYSSLHLRKMNWRDFIKKDNPVAAALLSKMGYHEQEKVKVKLEFLKILTRLEINLEKRGILLHFFESYLALNKEEEEILMESVRKHEDAEQIFEVTNSYIEQGIERGIEQGLEQGVERGIEIVAKEMLQDGFSVDKVIQLTKLDRAKVEVLKKNLL